MTTIVNKIIGSRGYNSHFRIYFLKPMSKDTNSFKTQTTNILTQQHQLSRSLNKSRVMDLARTSGNFLREENLQRHLYEFCTFDEKKPLFGNEVDEIIRATAIQRCLL